MTNSPHLPLMSAHHGLISQLLLCMSRWACVAARRLLVVCAPRHSRTTWPWARRGAEAHTLPALST